MQSFGNVLSKTRLDFSPWHQASPAYIVCGLRVHEVPLINSVESTAVGRRYCRLTALSAEAKGQIYALRRQGIRVLQLFMFIVPSFNINHSLDN